MSNRRFLDSYGKSCPKWIPVACCCLLHLSGLDGLFLTRRPWHMRSYPGVWVPPGGHCEAKEPIQVCFLNRFLSLLGNDHIFCLNKILCTNVSVQYLEKQGFQISQFIYSQKVVYYG